MTKNISIRQRLTWYVIGTLAVLSLISGVAVYKGTTHEADEIFDASLAQTARILEGLLTRQSILANKEHLENALARYRQASQLAEDADSDGAMADGHEYEKKLFFVIRDKAGETLLTSHHSPDIQHRLDKPGFQRIKLDGKDWISFTLLSGENDLWIIVGERGDIRDEIVEYIGQGILLPLLFLLPVVVFFLWKIIVVAMKPLREVIGQIHKQNIRELSPIQAGGIPQEVAPLVSAFNQMLDKLNVSYKRERRFVSDASHELRNPLAALLINVDNAIEETSDSDRDESLEHMKTSIGRLSHLVSQLLHLSHSENPLSGLHREPTDLTELCQYVYEIHTPPADKKNQTLTLLAPSVPLSVDGVKPLLTSLISNLMDNAIKYSPQESTIELTCHQSGDSIVLSVDDSGKGLDSEAREKVMERFYRHSRSKEQGAGLGLSIAKSIADIHQAKMELSRSPLGGLRVTISFPLAPPFTPETA